MKNHFLANKVLRRLLERLEKQRGAFAKGLTVLEVLLAIGILAFTLCGIMVTYTSTMALIATTKSSNIATDAAMGLMEEIRAGSFTRIKNDYDGLVFTVNNLPSSVGVVYVNNTNPELLRVTTSVCWRQGNRVIGEDTNLDGVLAPAEDTNGNGIIDSPVKLETRIANK